MVISNYVLWPLANSLNAHLVPAEHRKIAGHIITVRQDLVPLWVCQRVCLPGHGGLLLVLTGALCLQIIWNAWLSAMLSQVAVLGAPAALAGHAGHAAAAAAAGAAGHSVSESVMASVDALDVPLVGRLCRTDQSWRCVCPDTQDDCTLMDALLAGDPRVALCARQRGDQRHRDPAPRQRDRGAGGKLLVGGGS